MFKTVYLALSKLPCIVMHCGNNLQDKLHIRHFKNILWGYSENVLGGIIPYRQDYNLFNSFQLLWTITFFFFTLDNVHACWVIAFDFAILLMNGVLHLSVPVWLATLGSQGVLECITKKSFEIACLQLVLSHINIGHLSYLR